jgi:hypothetical protein
MYIEEDSDDESYLSDEDDYENSVYEPEEQSTTKYNIVLCELYNKNIHGISSNQSIKYNYLTITRYKVINNLIYYYAKRHYNHIYNNSRHKRHDIFKNYKKIISNKNYIKPEIAECIYLQNGGECIAILKTCWIRLIQRTWKNIYKKRMTIIKKRCNLNSLKYKEIYGKWPNNCNEYPCLKGMLSFLTRPLI